MFSQPQNSHFHNNSITSITQNLKTPLKATDVTEFNSIAEKDQVNEGVYLENEETEAQREQLE